MTKLRSNARSWVEDGKKAANSGKTGEALHILMALFIFVIEGMSTIVDNQFEIYDALTKGSAPKPAANGQSKP